MNYSVFYNKNVNDGSVRPAESAEVIQRNVANQEQRLAANWSALESSKLLNGLTILFHFKSIGVMTVTGEEGAIKTLDAFLKSQNIGSAGEQIRVRPAEEALRNLKKTR